MDEETIALPVAPYGVTKLAGTRMVLSLAEDTGVDAAVLRVFNPVGPGAPTTTLPGRTASLLRDHPPGTSLRLAPLDSYRDFVDARDIAAAVVACVQADKLPSRVYNIGSGKATLSRNLVQQLVRAAGFTGDVQEEVPPSDRSGAVAWQQANIRRANAELGWAPRYNLTDSLIDLWRCSS